MWQRQSRYLKEFDSEPFLKTKITSYGDETTEFHDKENPKVGSSNHTCLAGISLDFALKIDENIDWVQIHRKKKLFGILLKTEGFPSNFDKE